MAGRYRAEREHDVEDYLVQRVKGMGGVAFKFRTPPRVGSPDRIIILPGPRIGWIETKRPKGGRYGPGQERYIKLLTDLGCVAEFAKTCREVDAVLERIAQQSPGNWEPVTITIKDLLS